MLCRFRSSTRQFFDGWVKVIRFTRHFKPIRRKAMLANICGGLASGLQLVVPLATITIINDVLPNKNTQKLFELSLIMAMSTLGAIVASYFEFYFASIFRERVSLKLGVELLEHIQSQPYLFFKNNESGYVMSRITNDANTALDISASFTGIGRSLVWLLSGIALLPFFNKLIGFAIILVIPFYCFLLVWFNRRTKDAFNTVQEKTAIVSRELYESLSGIYETKAYGAHRYRARRYATALIEKARISIRARMLMNAGGQVAQVVTLLLSLFIIIYGGAAVIAGDLSLGALIGINALTAYLIVPINRVVGESLRAQQAIASMDRIDELMALESEPDQGNATNLPRTRGHIRYENVSFAYENRPPVLRDISFEILPGEVVLLAGASGIGKTTLVNLLLKFLEPTGGQIYLDEVDIKERSPSYLRQQIALVSQDVFLFSDSIFNNIRMGKLSASYEDVREAAKSSNIMDLIEQLSQGFETQVGERGARLSGGQRQRIAIARALVRNAPLLILDEATSAVDTETEAAVHEALSRLMEDRTTIIIAHHSSAFIEKVDRILVLEDGYLKTRSYPLPMRLSNLNVGLTATD